MQPRHDRQLDRAATRDCGVDRCVNRRVQRAREPRPKRRDRREVICCSGLNSARSRNNARKQACPRWAAACAMSTSWTTRVEAAGQHCVMVVERRVEVQLQLR